MVEPDGLIAGARQLASAASTWRSRSGAGQRLVGWLLVRLHPGHMRIAEDRHAAWRRDRRAKPALAATCASVWPGRPYIRSRLTGRCRPGAASPPRPAFLGLRRPMRRCTSARDILHAERGTVMPASPAPPPSDHRSAAGRLDRQLGPRAEADRRAGWRTAREARGTMVLGVPPPRWIAATRAWSGSARPGCAASPQGRGITGDAAGIAGHRVWQPQYQQSARQNGIWT